MERSEFEDSAKDYNNSPIFNMGRQKTYRKQKDNSFVRGSRNYVDMRREHDGPYHMNICFVLCMYHYVSSLL